MKANGFQWFPNTNATHVLKKTACNVTHFFCNKSMRQNRCSPCYCGRAPLPWRCSNRSKSIYSLVCSTEPLFFLAKFAANAFPAHYLALLLVFYFGFGCCLFFSCRLSLPWAGQGFNAGHSCESFFSEERLHWRDWLCEIC